MKKNLLFILSSIVIIILAVFTSYNLKLNNSQFSLIIANIEALTSSESGSGIRCYETISNQGSGNSTHITYCGDCEATLCKFWSSEHQCNTK